MMYDLIIIWESGERELFAYSTRELAEKYMLSYQIAFGHQIRYIDVIERRLKIDGALPL